MVLINCITGTFEVWQVSLKTRQVSPLSSAVSCLWTLSGPPLQGACMGQGQGPFHQLLCVWWWNCPASQYTMNAHINQCSHNWCWSATVMKKTSLVSAKWQEKIYKDIYYDCMSNWTSRDLFSSTNTCESLESTRGPASPLTPNSTVPWLLR